MAVVGDAGVGKTALVGHLGTQAVAAGWRLVHAVGVEAEKSFSLGGLNQMVFGLRSLVPRLDVRDRDVLATVFGADPATPPTPMALTVALLNLLSEAALQQPVLLVVEDVHWLDDLSATVLNAAGRRVIDPRVRVVATYRPHAGTPLCAGGLVRADAGTARPRGLRADRRRVAAAVEPGDQAGDSRGGRG